MPLSRGICFLFTSSPFNGIEKVMDFLYFRNHDQDQKGKN